jgi:probable HAF family extracellular repeat protein
LTFIGGGDVGQAYAINNNGQIVGEHDNPEFDPNAFLYGNGILSAVGVPTNYSVATAINNTGSIVGVIGPSNFPIQTHGFRFANGTMEDLNVLAATTGISSATGINDSGAIVGTETNRHSFLFANGQLTDLGLLPAGTFCQANAINNSGETVGQADTIISTSSYTHAFSYLAGTITDLAPGQAAYYAANALNNSGQIVGTMSDDAFVYNGGVMFDLNNLVVPNAMANPYLAEAVGINDLGQIVVNSNPAEGMYILTPTYQPQFEATALNGGELQLTWSALQAFPPVGYQIQYATDLAASNWANLGLPVCGTNGTLSTNVTFNPSAQGFYRILVVQ